MDTRLQQEIHRRTEHGFPPMSVAELNQALRGIGYRLDRSAACAYNAKYLTGEHAGQTYPCISTRVVEAETGMSFAHVDARRDNNFQALQLMRFEESHYAVVNKAILTI